mmetsp:Transcript_26325/g.39099  ORF Transcript_26325/g.39099 Transcript_26325/m.39099 type:complete len:119 (+) Transcript_26325:592-948(+)
MYEYSLYFIYPIDITIPLRKIRNYFVCGLNKKLAYNIFTSYSTFIASSNWPAKEFAALNHQKIKPPSITARYGVAAARLPTLKMRNCWINEPPLFPSGLPMTSTAALPFVLESWSRGM